MNKAIFYKEWIKTGKYFGLAAAVFLCFTAYALLRMNRVVEFKGAEHLWEILLTRDNVFIELIGYIPAVCAIVIALAQFVPEMLQKRLKLTLHLPFPQQRMILTMLAAGLMELVAIYALQIIAIWGYTQTVLAGELVSRIILTSLPWFASGIAVYLLTTAACIEPVWKMKAAILLIAAGMFRLFFLQNAPEAYNGSIAALTLASLLCVAVSLHSVIRFKEGCQD